MERRVIVLKVGGSLGNSQLQAALQAVTAAQKEGAGVVMVHGGGPRITQALAETGLHLEFRNGYRVTTPAAMEVVRRVLCDEINQALVQQLSAAGAAAVGLAGRTSVFAADPLPGLERTAKVAHVSVDVVRAALQRCEVPVLAPVARGPEGFYNVNADVAAAAVAGAVQAERMIFLTDVAGIYQDYSRGIRLSHTTASELKAGLCAGWFAGGMEPKVKSVLDSVQAGVATAFVVDGRDADSVLWAAVTPMEQLNLSARTAAGETGTTAQAISPVFPGTCVTAG